MILEVLGLSGMLLEKRKLKNEKKHEFGRVVPPMGGARLKIGKVIPNSFICHKLTRGLGPGT